jgi:hypothetical protein
MMLMPVLHGLTHVRTLLTLKRNVMIVKSCPKKPSARFVDDASTAARACKFQAAGIPQIHICLNLYAGMFARGADA